MMTPQFWCVMGGAVTVPVGIHLPRVGKDMYRSASQRGVLMQLFNREGIKASLFSHVVLEAE